jgi:hypothetical protein
MTFHNRSQFNTLHLGKTSILPAEAFSWNVSHHAETPHPPTDPTTLPAQYPTFVPSCTSIETSLVESEPTITSSHSRYAWFVRDGLLGMQPSNEDTESVGCLRDATGSGV